MCKITTENTCFVDKQGRQCIFNGLNMVCKDPEYGFVYPLDVGDYQRLVHSGINILRFGLFWAAVEPQPGDRKSVV